MDDAIKTHMENIYLTTDREAQTAAYYALMAATDQPVDWAYAVWDEVLKAFHHKDAHVRSIAGQLMSNLAKSDPEKRLLKDFDGLLAVTKDEKFVTARHTLQNLWKFGVAGVEQQQKYMEGMERRYNECVTEKNGTLIRSDILESIKNVYLTVKDERIKAKALALIELEADPKYHKKYAAIWKKA